MAHCSTMRSACLEDFGRPAWLILMVLGFIVFMMLVGWHPTDKRGQKLALEEPHHLAVHEIDLLG